MPQNTEDPITSSVWMRPARSKRGRPPLSREEIVRAAIDLLDAEGLDGLSMRRLGATLGAGATSLYFYVANKEELLELALDEIMGEVDVPDAAEVGWRAAAGGFAQGLRAMILRHPWMIGLLGGRPAIGPNALRASERAVAVLMEAGFTGLDLYRASGLLTSHAIGSAVTDAALHTATARAGKGAREWLEQLDPYIEGVAADHPHFAAWWRENKGLDLEKHQDDNFTFGLERLLDGLETWLATGRG